MKFFLHPVLLFLLIINPLQSQTQNEAKIYVGVTQSSFEGEGLDGGASFDVENAYEVGFKYLLYVTENLALESGLNYWKADVKISSSPMPDQTIRNEILEITSIPIFANFTFSDYFFINGGPVMDFQFSENDLDSQSGIGVGLGAGAKYHFNNFQIFINPNIRRYSVIPFEEENFHQKLTSFGVQAGIGYRF